MDDGPHLLALPFLSTAELWLTGRWGEGGIALLRDGSREATFSLPPTLFTLLGVLTLAAKEPRSNRACRAGFRSVAELGRELRRRTEGKDNLLLPDPQHIIRYIYRARNLFAKAMSQAEQGSPGIGLDYHDWALQLLEYRAFLGYRLSTPAERLRLMLLDESAHRETSPE